MAPLLLHVNKDTRPEEERNPEYRFRQHFTASPATAESGKQWATVQSSDQRKTMWYKLHTLALILSKVDKTKAKEWTSARHRKLEFPPFEEDDDTAGTSEILSEDATNFLKFAAEGSANVANLDEKSESNISKSSSGKKRSLGMIIDNLKKAKEAEGGPHLSRAPRDARGSRSSTSAQGAPPPTFSYIFSMNTIRSEGFKPLIWTLMSAPESSPLALGISLFILVFIVLSSVTFCLESMEQFQDPTTEKIFAVFEVLCISVFSIEYLTKLWAAPERRKFVKQMMNVIDLISILPFYFEFFLAGSNIDTRILRVLRLARVFRVFKLGGRFSKMQVVGTAVIDSVDMLVMLVFLLFMAMIFFSTLVYFCENGFADNDDGKEDPFRSIPSSFWWCIVTLMTVGYGDAVPQTIWGRLVAVLTMLASVIILALPISVIGANFTHHWLIYKENMKLKEQSGKLTANLTELTFGLKLHIHMRDFLLIEIRAMQEKLNEIMQTIHHKQTHQRMKRSISTDKHTTPHIDKLTTPSKPSTPAKPSTPTTHSTPAKNSISPSPWEDEGEVDSGLEAYFLCATLLRDHMDDHVKLLMLIASDDFNHITQLALRLQKKARQKVEESTVISKQFKEVSKDVEEITQLFHLSITGRLR